MAPMGNIIFSASDLASVVEDLPPTIDTDVIPELLDNTALPKGIKFTATNVKQIETFFNATFINRSPRTAKVAKSFRPRESHYITIGHTPWQEGFNIYNSNQYP
jgi:hypothetical protein